MYSDESILGKVSCQNEDYTHNGGIKELVKLVIPLLMISFSNLLFLLVEKIFLARLSVDAMNAAMASVYVCQVLQIPCVAIALMTQVYLGRLLGANQKGGVGPVVWQMIWFSALSMIVTVPAGLAYGSYYFHGSDFEGIIWPYFCLNLAINFMFPLSTTLSCFYIATRKIYFLFLVTVLSQVLKIVCGYLFIFGWGDWIPSLGLLGGAISLLLAMTVLCSLLFFRFLAGENAKVYKSHAFQFKWKLFWEGLHPGILRAFNRILSVTSWVAITRLMIVRGGDYSVVLSVGGALFLFLPFLSEGLLQAQITAISGIIGSRKLELISKSIRSGTFIACVAIVIIGIPLLVFPRASIYYLFPTIPFGDFTIYKLMCGVWLCFGLYTLGVLPLSVVLAFKDTKFSLFMGGVSWINGYLLMYTAIEVMNIAPEQFWFVLGLMHGSTLIMYYLRMKWLEAKAKRQPTLLSI
ncbi:MAG: hypothetical protein K940chlam7_01434 [Chlamydiae bacterium]|nr:hypothetical protein [Chlamydiota bacterium]